MCIAKTKAGKDCKNNSKYGPYCGLHRPKKCIMCNGYIPKIGYYWDICSDSCRRDLNRKCNEDKKRTNDKEINDIKMKKDKHKQKFIQDIETKISYLANTFPPPLCRIIKSYLVPVYFIK